MVFVFVIYICKFIFFAQVLFKYFSSTFRNAYFSLNFLKLQNLFNQFKNCVVALENTTFSSFKL